MIEPSRSAPIIDVVLVRRRGMVGCARQHHTRDLLSMHQRRLIEDLCHQREYHGMMAKGVEALYSLQSRIRLGRYPNPIRRLDIVDARRRDTVSGCGSLANPTARKTELQDGAAHGQDFVDR